MKKVHGLILVCAMLLSACNENQKTTNQGSERTTETQKSTISGVGIEHPNFITKYNAYIYFQNGFHQNLISTSETYYREFDPAEPITKDNRPIIYSYGTHDLSSQFENIKTEPKLPKLDQAAAKLFTYAKSLDSLFSLSAGYYSRKAYEEDNFKRGKALSAQVESNMEKYFTFYGEYMSQIDSFQRALTEKDLKQLKEEGAEVRYNLLASIVAADDLVLYLNNQSANQFKDIDFAKVDQYLQVYQKHIATIESLSTDTEKMKEALGYKHSFINNFLLYSNGLVRETKGLKDRIKKNNWDLSPTHKHIPDSGTLEAVIKAHSNVINNYNNMM